MSLAIVCNMLIALTTTYDELVASHEQKHEEHDHYNGIMIFKTFLQLPAWYVS
jgi:hypothetical protein